MLKCQYLDMYTTMNCIYTYRPHAADVARKWGRVLHGILGIGIVMLGLILGAKYVFMVRCEMSAIVQLSAYFAIILGVAFCTTGSCFIIFGWPSVFSVCRSDDGLVLVKGRVNKTFPAEIKWEVGSVTLCECPIYYIRVKFIEGAAMLRFYHIEELDEFRACLEGHMCVKLDS